MYMKTQQYEKLKQRAAKSKTEQCGIKPFFRKNIGLREKLQYQ